MSGRPAVFFDRDGTLMEDAHYCGDPAEVKVYPGVSDALRKLREAGFATVVVSNQSGIGRVGSRRPNTAPSSGVLRRREPA